MPKFLVKQELYRLIQRELPEDVYPDSGDASKFKSTASVMAKAKVFESVYTNQSRIYANFFPQSADENIGDWEDKIFGFQNDSSVDLQQRRDAIISKIRTRRRVTPSDIKAIVYQVVPADTKVEIVEWNCGGGGWILDVSMLDVSTILNAGNGLKFPPGTNLCDKTAADWGMSQEDFTDYQNQAYTYSVQIYNYTLTSDQRDQLEKLLSSGEPARSAHKIVDGLDYDTQALGGES